MADGGQLQSFFNNLLRRQAREANDEGSLEWLERVSASGAAGRQARWDAAGPSFDYSRLTPEVVVNSSDVVVETRDVTPETVIRDGEIVSFPREVESRALPGVTYRPDVMSDVLNLLAPGFEGDPKGARRELERRLGGLVAPFEQPSRAIGSLVSNIAGLAGVEGGEVFNPFVEGRVEGPLVSEALRELGAPEWLAVMSEFGVPDPVGVSKAGDLIPLISMARGFTEAIQRFGVDGTGIGLGLVGGRGFGTRGGVRNYDLITPDPTPPSEILTDLSEAISTDVPVVLAGHPRFRAIRQDNSAIYAVTGRDPGIWRRDGTSGIYTMAPTGRTQKSYDKAYSAVMQNADLIRRFYERGVRMGADKWYQAQERLDAFIAAIGDPLSGRAAFDLFNELSAISSAGAMVPNEIKRSIYLWSRLLAGDSLGSFTNQDLSRAGGYGHAFWKKSMQPAYARFDEGVDPFLATSLKTPSYYANKSGDMTIFTVDSWMRRIADQIYEDGKLIGGVPKNDAQGAGYVAAYKELAQGVGVDPAPFQSAVWAGSELVENSEAFQQVFMNNIEQLARQRGEPVEDTLRGWIRGELGLEDILGPTIVSDLTRRALFDLRERYSQEGGEDNE